ncbi:MAG: DUF2806 domain-containing protein [Rhodocyclaceae bacterium]|nr:DUF2806 domain-containing protein [Rhodocyclaceae bacterium]
MDVKDLVGVSKPATKLIEVISAGMGRLYEPVATRRKADADAYAVKALSVAEGEAAIVKAETQALAQVRQLEILANGDAELIQRARLRVLTREVEGQCNVEAIAEQALKHLPASVSEAPVSDDWRRKFFLEAENVCDADLQLLWGKVLAGETASPGSYSVRTLGILKNVSRYEAEIFMTFCGLASDHGHVVNMGNNKLKEFGISYGSLLTLRDAGLLHENDNLHRDFGDLPDLMASMVEINNGVFIELSAPNIRNMKIPCYPLTQAGQELRNLIPPNPCEPYLKAMGQYLRQKGFSVKRGRIKLLPDQPGTSAINFDEDL